VKIVSGRTNLLLLLGVVLLVVLPLALVHGKFEGSDDQGSAAIAASVPGFKPWAHPVWTPPSPEIESLLFALQAALGAGVIGYVVGRIHGASQAKDASKATESSTTKKAPAKARGAN
jgi:cobalt/nickel transport protein